MSPHYARQVMQNWHCSEINLLRSLSARAVPDILCMDLRNFPQIVTGYLNLLWDDKDNFIFGS